MNELEKKHHAKKMEEIQQKLEEGVKEIFSSEKYKDYIRSMSKLHNYSFNNCVLIATQCPEATMVCGYKTWKKEFNRSVNRGEHGIMIYRPIKVKYNVSAELLDDDKDLSKHVDKSDISVEKEFITFRPTYVFDVSQTSGEPIPKLTSELEDVVESYDEMKKVLVEISPVPITFEKINGSANGYYSAIEERIVIDQELSELHTVKTIIHEIAHASLNHGNKDLDTTKDRNTKEVQAESVAYWVTQALGYDTSDYSFGYIAGWSKDKSVPELKESLDVIKQTSDQIFTSIESKIKDMSIESKNKEVEKKKAI